MLLMAACGSGTHPTGAATSPGASPTASSSVQPSASPSAAPAVVCSAANRCLALVTLRGSNDIVVRDVTDISQARTVGNLGQISIPQFVSASEVSYADGSDLVRQVFTGSTKSRVATNTDLVNYAIAWSPDGNSVVYKTQASGSTGAMHKITGGQDSTIATGLPPTPAVGCETQFCSLLDSWDFRLAFSPDGTMVALVESVLQVNVFRVWSSDGKVLDKSDSKGRSMSAWSGNTLYFHDATGVAAWHSGMVSPFMPGVSWIRPRASPAGGRIVYETVDAQGWAHVSVVDTTTRQVREIKQARNEPTFLTDRYLWYRGERACVASDGCPSGWAVVNSGKTYIYDLQTGIESESIISNVYDVWPHAA
jgi:WD40 repeat protein